MTAEAIAQLKASAAKGELIVVLGAGASVALTNGKAPSWLGLMKNGLKFCLEKGKITEAVQKPHLDALDTGDFDSMLGVAEFIGRKLGGAKGPLYIRWLQAEFASLSPTNTLMVDAINALHSTGLSLATLNYDHLLEQVTGLHHLLIADKNAVTKWLQREHNAILHLHGSYEVPASCVLGISDYNDTQHDPARQFFQQVLGGVKHLLFVGCGETLADPNLSQLVKWLNCQMPGAAKQHYALVKSDEMAARHADGNWHGFVEPLCYGNEYADLTKFLLQNFGTISMASVGTGKKTPRKNVSKGIGSTEKYAKLLDSYRHYLLKNCGQMTIEGMGCDMNAGQQRFDLDKLFVPVMLQACPPDLPLQDEGREEKLKRWQADNEEPQAFSKVFVTNKQLVLLALPGGGKTMLLQRLAVAYAASVRRMQSDDELPELQLTPLMLRCREWRAHIKQPILTLLKNLADITGEAGLQGLDSALLPLLRKGQILLLVDGLDEIHDDAARTIFVDHLEAFIGQFPKIRVVITSREAGFQLVAPSLLRFCQRWRIAPLDKRAIYVLCDYWHALMYGVSAEQNAEAQLLATALWQNESLRRLAETPLLLTMLLVVKHGASRLPANRVSLYGRAVEVLLDTWNIKGHEALNVKEALPQLAFIAHSMMCEGKQTATESELLAYIEQARNVPRIALYVRDTPDVFLKRVEKRSSLLMEAGRQIEGNKSVPFFQFRHLTFQEYLVAVALSEKYYRNQGNKDTLLTPLKPYLGDEKWKEVIPMAAVLAGHYAEPLLAELLKQGRALNGKLLNGKNFNGREAWLYFPSTLPRPVALLVQCLTEEAQTTPETLDGILQLIPVFAKAMSSKINWRALCIGPYGKHLLHQTGLLFATLNWRMESRVLETYADFAFVRAILECSASLDYLQATLESSDIETITTGLVVCRGLENKSDADAYLQLLPQIEKHLSHHELSICLAAACAWGRLHFHPEKMMLGSPSAIDRLLSMWLDEKLACGFASVSDALGTQLGHDRLVWQPKLSVEHVKKVRETFNTVQFSKGISVACVLIGFHARNVWDEEELAKKLAEIREFVSIRLTDAINAMLQQMGEIGKKFLIVGTKSPSSLSFKTASISNPKPALPAKPRLAR